MEIVDRNDIKCQRFWKETSDTGYVHVHGIVYFSKSLPISTVIKLYSPLHVEFMVNSLSAAIEYCSKGKCPIDTWNIGTCFEQIMKSASKPKGPRIDLDALLNQCRNMANIVEACNHYSAVAPRDYMLNRDKIRKDLVEHIPVKYTRYPKNSFNDKWTHYVDKRKINVIYGETRTGKTKWVTSHYNVFIVNKDRSNMEEYNARLYDALLFDDPDITQYHVDDLKMLGNIEDDRYLKVRYVNAFIPSGTVIFFVMNVDWHKLIKKAEWDKNDKKAIKQRVHVWPRIDKPMWNWRAYVATDDEDTEEEVVVVNDSDIESSGEFYANYKFDKYSIQKIDD